MKIVIVLFIISQICHSARGYYFYRRSDATPPPPPPEVQALIELLHTLEQNYKLTDEKLNVTEDEDEKAMLEELKDSNKKIAEAMFKDQEIEQIIEEVIELFDAFEAKYTEWEEAHAAKKKRRLMKATRRNDEKVEQINELKVKVEGMNSAMGGGGSGGGGGGEGGGGEGGGGEAKRKGRRMLTKNFRRSGSSRNARRTFKTYARNLHGQTNKAFSSLRKNLRALLKGDTDVGTKKQKKAKRRTDETEKGKSGEDSSSKEKEMIKRDIGKFVSDLTKLTEGLVDNLFNMLEDISPKDEPIDDDEEDEEEGDSEDEKSKKK